MLHAKKVNRQISPIIQQKLPDAPSAKFENVGIFGVRMTTVIISKLPGAGNLDVPKRKPKLDLMSS